MKKRNISLLTIVAFMLYYLMIMRILPSPIKYSSQNWSFLLFNVQCSIPACVVLYLIHKKEILKSIGLDRNIIQGFTYGFICVVPMLLYMLLFGRWNNSISLLYLFNATVVAGFFEELLFRGLLFGQLFRYAKWGFLPAILVASFIFGLGHIYQGTDITSSILAGLITGLGGILFGWIYIETNYSLWCNAFLHILMNFSWTAFSNVNNGAIGDVGTNIARALTIIIAVCLVIFYKRKKNIPYIVTFKKLLINK